MSDQSTAIGPKGGVFEGLKVVDTASFIAGPCAATILGDFGAEVIKVEPPGIGDPNRMMYKIPPNPACEVNYAWQLHSRNKRSIVINFKTPEGQEVKDRLVGWADVLVTNFPPRVRESLKLDYESVSALNPRLIHASLTGYGAQGPEADKPGFDITAYWARSGLMQFTRNKDAPPAVPVPGIGDAATAVALYAGIVTALFQRERTGKGSAVDTALIANGAWQVGHWLQAGLMGARFTGLIDRANPPNALGNSYRCADDRWLMLCFAVEDKNWPVFAKLIGREDLISDPRFEDTPTRHAHAEALTRELDKTFAEKPIAYWRELMDPAGLPYSAMQIPAEILQDKQLFENDYVVPIADGPYKGQYTVNSPFFIAGSSKAPAGPAPELGEHTDAVLKDLGYDDAAIKKLHAAKAVVSRKA